MTLEKAKQILKDHGRPTCTCKYGGSTEAMIAEAQKLLDEKE